MDMFDFRNPAWRRRLLVMILGVVIIGLGVCLFRLSLMGNDPSSAFVLALGNRLGLPFSVMLIIVNTLWFIAEIALGRRYIGAGTFFNWFCVGVFADLFTSLIANAGALPESIAGRLAVMLLGVIILSFSGALYQTANLGIAPYDALSIVMADRLPIPYFWCRITTDSCCALIAFLLGGVIGLGTLFCALGLGPFISFFTRTVARRMCGYGPEDENSPI